MTLTIFDPMSGKLVTIAKPRPKSACAALPDASAHRTRHGMKAAIPATMTAAIIQMGPPSAA